LTGEADPVALVARRAEAPILVDPRLQLAPQGEVVVEPAAGEDHAAPGAQLERPAVALGADTADAPILAEQLAHRGLAPDLDPALPQGETQPGCERLTADPDPLAGQPRFRDPLGKGEEDPLVGEPAPLEGEQVVQVDRGDPGAERELHAA